MLKNAIWLFIFAVVVFFIFLPSYTQLQDLKQKNLEYQTKIRDLEKEKAQLTQEKRLLIEDPVYLEKVAREKMGLIREGEVVYQIVPAQPGSGKNRQQNSMASQAN